MDSTQHNTTDKRPKGTTQDPNGGCVTITITDVITPSGTPGLEVSFNYAGYNSLYSTASTVAQKFMQDIDSHRQAITRISFLLNKARELHADNAVDPSQWDTFDSEFGKEGSDHE